MTVAIPIQFSNSYSNTNNLYWGYHLLEGHSLQPKTMFQSDTAWALTVSKCINMPIARQLLFLFRQYRVTLQIVMHFQLSANETALHLSRFVSSVQETQRHVICYTSGFYRHYLFHNSIGNNKTNTLFVRKHASMKLCSLCSENRVFE